jgi:hypothetical protein
MSDKEKDFDLELKEAALEMSAPLQRRMAPLQKRSSATSEMGSPVDSQSTTAEKVQLLKTLPRDKGTISLEEFQEKVLNNQETMFRIMAEDDNTHRLLLSNVEDTIQTLDVINTATDNINTSLNTFLPALRKDQRDQRDVVEDTRQLVQQTDSDVHAILLFMKEFKTSFDSLERRITSIETGVTGVGQALVDVGTEVRGTREDVREVGTEVKGTREDVREVGTEVKSARIEMRESFNDVKNVLHENFSLIIGKLDTLNKQLSQRCELKYNNVGAFVNSFVWCILVFLWFVSQFIKTVYTGYMFVKNQIIDTISRFFPFVKDNVELLLRMCWLLFEISYLILIIDKLCLFLNFPKIGLFLIGKVFRFFMQAIIQCFSIIQTILWSFTQPVRELLYVLYKESGAESIMNWLFSYIMGLFSKAGSWFADIMYTKMKSNFPKLWGGTKLFTKRKGEKIQAKMYMDELVALMIEYRKNPSKMNFVLRKYNATLSNLEEHCMDILGTMGQYFYNIMFNKTSKQEKINKQFQAHINRTPNITLQLKHFLDGFQDVTQSNVKKLHSHFNRIHKRKTYPKLKHSRSTGTKRTKSRSARTKSHSTRTKRTKSRSTKTKRTKSTKTKRTKSTKTKSRSTGTKRTKHRPNTY